MYSITSNLYYVYVVLLPSKHFFSPAKGWKHSLRDTPLNSLVVRKLLTMGARTPQHQRVRLRGPGVRAQAREFVEAVTKNKHVPLDAVYLRSFDFELCVKLWCV